MRRELDKVECARVRPVFFVALREDINTPSAMQDQHDCISNQDQATIFSERTLRLFMNCWKLRKLFKSLKAYSIFIHYIKMTSTYSAYL